MHLQEALLKDQRNRFEAGTVPRFNVLRAEVELANVIPNLIRAKNDYLLAQLSLAKLLGLEAASSGQPITPPQARRRRRRSLARSQLALQPRQRFLGLVDRSAVPSVRSKSAE